MGSTRPTRTKTVTVIILDLGADYDNIKTFTLSYLAETDVGICAPSPFRFISPMKTTAAIFIRGRWL